jgi:TRAP-type C4-dicarboxylate transport system substrate-binding protein
LEARKYCQDGGKVATTTPQQLDAFREATAPVYAELEKDPSTKALIARLRELASAVEAEAAVEPCDYDTY